MGLPLPNFLIGGTEPAGLNWLFTCLARHPDVYLGASPRASIMLLRAGRAMAASDGRDYAIPDDIKTLAVPVLAHRLIVSADAAMSGRNAETILADTLDEVPVPVTG